MAGRDVSRRHCRAPSRRTKYRKHPDPPMLVGERMYGGELRELEERRRRRAIVARIAAVVVVLMGIVAWMMLA